MRILDESGDRVERFLTIGRLSANRAMKLTME
jgi:hypothetical protein